MRTKANEKNCKEQREKAFLEKQKCAFHICKEKEEVVENNDRNLKSKDPERLKNQSIFQVQLEKMVHVENVVSTEFFYVNAESCIESDADLLQQSRTESLQKKEKVDSIKGRKMN